MSKNELFVCYCPEEGQINLEQTQEEYRRRKREENLAIGDADIARLEQSFTDGVPFICPFCDETHLPMPRREGDADE